MISAFFIMGFIKCNNHKQKEIEVRTIFYRSFDLFYLKGDEIIKKTGEEEFVEVQYSKENIPISIRYVKPNREVYLELKDSISLSDFKPVYVYTTSNFHGGKPGNRRIYGTHYEEYEDEIYISRTDTIICKSFQVPNSVNYDYALYLYVRIGGLIYKHQGAGNTLDDSDISQPGIYLRWIKELNTELSNYKYPKITLKKLPE